MKLVPIPMRARGKRTTGRSAASTRAVADTAGPRS
jgi:hypothetical protein